MDVLFEPTTCLAQDRIACPMPPGIINVLEMIQVDEHDCTALLRPLASREFLRDVVHHSSMIGQACQWVDQCHTFKVGEFKLPALILS